MSFRSIMRDVRDGFGSLSRRSFEVRLPGHQRGKSRSSVHELHDQPPVIQNSRWASLPPELLRDVIKRLETNESTWPSRKHVVACAAVCKSWREMCKEIPGYRDGPIQCFIKRDKSKLTYHLFLCLSPALKFQYFIWSNFLGTKFIIYDTQPPYNNAQLAPPGRSRRFYSKKVSPKVPSGSYNIAQVTYELNVLGTRGPRRMNCTMYSVPASSLEPGGIVPGQPELIQRSLEDSFRSLSFARSIDNSTDRDSPTMTRLFFSLARLERICLRWTIDTLSRHFRLLRYV
ncbi:hypothetical protein TSUD_42970 [Trifolium subterraneum]|uniref:F-box domain-containing protein n=1 Tax=Trifolium subterraneum TaxID=3900 RepID=A0A2Z6LHG6_TRISU|nr:hypothetical protein TSUD_42970 [Trifolium subterraneum]